MRRQHQPEPGGCYCQEGGQEYDRAVVHDQAPLFEIPNSNIQHPEKPQHPTSNIQLWNLELGVSLEFGVWSLEFFIFVPPPPPPSRSPPHKLSPLSPDKTAPPLRPY